MTVCSHDGEEVFYESDFTTRVNDWTESTGTWSVDDGWCIRANLFRDALYQFDECNVPWGIAPWNWEARKTGGAEGFLIVFGADTLETTDSLYA